MTGNGGPLVAAEGMTLLDRKKVRIVDELTNVASANPDSAHIDE